MYAGVNRNGSYMSREAIEKAIPSIYGIPVVGEYLQEKSDFGTHGGKIVIDSNGIEFIETTKPYGFVALEQDYANVRWEDVEDEDGNTKNYLVADIHLWRKRYTELDTVFENGANQSMEININDFEWSDEKNAYDLKDFSFDALCMLGLSIEPCFEDASIKTYGLNKDEFKLEFSQMVKEIKESLLESNEVSVEENVEIFEEAQVEENAEIEMEVVEVQEFEAEQPIEETVEQENDVVEELETETQVEEFDYKAEYEKLSAEFVSLKEKFDTLEVELNVFKEKEYQLQLAEINSQKDELFEKYDELLEGNEEYSKIKELRDDYTVENLETTLAVIYVKSNVTFSVKQKKTSIIELGSENVDKKPVLDPYGGLFANKQ